MIRIAAFALGIALLAVPAWAQQGKPPVAIVAAENFYGDVARQIEPSLPLVVVVVAGMITGCAGGVLRDILCNDVPLLFRAELYASVSIVTGLFYSTAFGLKLNDELWTALTFVLGLSLRLLAIRYKWEMPKFIFDDERR